MANKISGKEFDQIKNEGYTAFTFEGDYRVMTYGNISLTHAMEIVMINNYRGRQTLIINDKQADELGLNRYGSSHLKSDYKHLFDVRWEISLQ